MVAWHVDLGKPGHGLPSQHALPKKHAMPPCPAYSLSRASTTLERYNLKERTAHYRQLVLDSRVVNSITSFSSFARASVQFVTVPVIKGRLDRSTIQGTGSASSRAIVVWNTTQTKQRLQRRSRRMNTTQIILLFDLARKRQTPRPTTRITRSLPPPTTAPPTPHSIPRPATLRPATLRKTTLTPEPSSVHVSKEPTKHIILALSNP